MKVLLKITVEVDADDWAAEYGCDKSEVRQDVRAYFDQHIANSEAIEAAGLTVRVA